MSIQEKPIILSPEEFDVTTLPSLYNSSSRRKKNADSLFPSLGNTVYRCKEFPNGVYINHVGEVCPDDPRTGIYREGEVTEDTDDDQDETDAMDTEEETANRKRKRAESDDEEETSEVEEDDADEEFSDVQTDSDDSDGESEETDEEKEDDDDSSSTGASLEELQREADTMDHVCQLEKRRKKERVKTQKLIDFLATFEEEWIDYKKKSRSKGDAQICLDTDANLHISSPYCKFKFFRKNQPRQQVTAQLDMGRCAVDCICGASFTDVAGVYQHVLTHL